MKFVCENCNTKYSIADDKVRRKVLKIRCKNCSHIVVVRDPKRSTQHRGRKSTGARALDQAFDRSFEDSAARRLSGGRQVIQAVQAQAARVDPIVEPEDMPTMLSAPSDVRAPEFSDEDEWYLAVDGHQFGPMSFDELCKRVKRGEARGDSGEEAFVWHDGFDDWLEVTSVPELRPYVPPPPPPRGRSGLFPMGEQPPPVSPPAAREVAPPPPGPRGPGRPAPPAMAAQADVAPAAAGSGLLTASVETSGPLVLPVAPEQAAVAAPRPPAAASTPLMLKLAALGGIVSTIIGAVILTYVFFFDRQPAPRGPTLQQSELARQASATAATSEQQEDPTADGVGDTAGGEEIKFPAIEIGRSEGKRSTGSRKRKVAANKSGATPDDGMSAADRAILDRFKGGDGVDIDVPKQQKPKRVTKSRNISQAEVQRLQLSNKRYIQSCYNRALKRDYSLKDSRADVTLVIGTSGRVKRIRFKGISSEALKSCLQSNLRRWVFRPLGGVNSVDVNFSLLFRGA